MIGKYLDEQYFSICVVTSIVAGAVIAFTNSKSAFAFLCTAGMCCLIATALLWFFPDFATGWTTDSVAEGATVDSPVGAIERHFNTRVSMAYIIFLVFGATLLSLGQQSAGLLL